MTRVHNIVYSVIWCFVRLFTAYAYDVGVNSDILGISLASLDTASTGRLLTWQIITIPTATTGITNGTVDNTSNNNSSNNNNNNNGNDDDVGVCIFSTLLVGALLFSMFSQPNGTGIDVPVPNKQATCMLVLFVSQFSCRQQYNNYNDNKVLITSLWSECQWHHLFIMITRIADAVLATQENRR